MKTTALIVIVTVWLILINTEVKNMRYKLRIIIITGLKNTYFVIGTVLLLLSSKESGGYWLMTIIDQYDAG